MCCIEGLNKGERELAVIFWGSFSLIVPLSPPTSPFNTNFFITKQVFPLHANKLLIFPIGATLILSLYIFSSNMRIVLREKSNLRRRSPIICPYLLHL
ncbi:hypothetical protein LguiA_019734 [Lonicera macranthoides]